MDAFLTDFGRGWFYRMAAKRMNYGIGTSAMGIKQDVNELCIERTLGSGARVLQTFTVGGGAYECFDDVGQFTFQSDWDNDGAVFIEGMLHETGEPFTMRRMRNGREELIDEISTSKGNTIRQVFVLQELEDEER